jgi:hypothetical protein
MCTYYIFTKLNIVRSIILVVYSVLRMVAYTHVLRIYLILIRSCYIDDSDSYAYANRASYMFAIPCTYSIDHATRAKNNPCVKQKSICSFLTLHT